MVDSFSTTNNKYSFEVDGKPHVLKGLTFGEVEQVAAAISGDTASQFDAIKGILESHADKRTLAAINSLGIPDVATLFKSWAGLSVGESQASAE